MLSQWGSLLARRGRALAAASTRAMSSSNKALIFERFGDPDQVLEYRECPAGHPGPGQVLLELIAGSFALFFLWAHAEGGRWQKNTPLPPPPSAHDTQAPINPSDINTIHGAAG